MVNNEYHNITVKDEIEMNVDTDKILAKLPPFSKNKFEYL